MSVLTHNIHVHKTYCPYKSQATALHNNIVPLILLRDLRTLHTSSNSEAETRVVVLLMYDAALAVCLAIGVY